MHSKSMAAQKCKTLQARAVIYTRNKYYNLTKLNEIPTTRIIITQIYFFFKTNS